MWRLGVVGSPIDHSRSPQLHEAGLTTLGLQGSSTRIEVSVDGAADFVTRMGRDLDAVSVTMPLKSILADHCSWRDESAQRLGVINSMRFHDGQIEGRATDGPGFLNALFGEWGFDVAGRHMLIEGSGGSAAALVDAVVHAGADHVTIVARNDEARRRIIASYDGVVSDFVDERHLDLVVTTTPAPGRAAPRHYAGVDATTCAVDITYNELVSPWLNSFVSGGLRVMNGLPMLAYQAALQMSWWWGRPLDGAALLAVLQ